MADSACEQLQPTTIFSMQVSRHSLPSSYRSTAHSNTLLCIRKSVGFFLTSHNGTYMDWLVIPILYNCTHCGTTTGSTDDGFLFTNMDMPACVTPYHMYPRLFDFRWPKFTPPVGPFFFEIPASSHGFGDCSDFPIPQFHTKLGHSHFHFLRFSCKRHTLVFVAET